MRVSVGIAAWCGLYVVIGLAGTWLARRYALHRRLLDEPGDRRSHRIATPRGGGIAIVVAMLVAICALILRAPAQIVFLSCAGTGLLLVASIGWIDDHRPLSPWLRLAVHGVAALLLSAGLYLGGASFLVAGLAFVSALVLVNVWNFMDGIDGLAASQAVIAAAALMLMADHALAVYLGLALIAATCGFVPFNFPRARIFLGDVGSGTLGYGLAMLAGLVTVDLAPQRWPLLLFPLSAFLVDATLTLSARIVAGERWWTPHVEHAYQRWVRHGATHPVVTGWYGVWSVAAVAALWAASQLETAGIISSVSVWLLGGIAVCHGLRRLEPLSDA